MYDPPEIKPEPTEEFIEAAQLVDSHRWPVAWMLAVQIAVLGMLSIWLTGFSIAAQIAMLAMLVGFLWYGNSFWLLPFSLVVFVGQLIRSNRDHFDFTPGIHLGECILVLVFLIASFRYIELGRYGQAFGLSDSYRRLDPTRNWKRMPWLTLVIGHFIRRQWYHSLIAMVVAFVMLQKFPVSDYWRDEFWMQPVAARFILLTLILFFGWFICRAIISMWDWFLLTPKQADVAFRSWANRELWSDMAGVERRRERLRNEL